MNETTTFGDWLRRRRKALDLTQEQLADRVGCSTETIRKIEAGTRRPSREIVELLAQKLAVPPEERQALVEFARIGVGSPGNGTAHIFLKEPTTPSPSTDLPRSLTAFVGRQKEIEALHSMLGRADMRLLTLTGAGGSGKTRLAVRVAEGVKGDFQDGVFFVSLASIMDPDVVASVTARRLGVRETPGMTILESLKSHVSSKQMLLLLDNFEHVLDAAPLVAELLSETSNLKIMVTSREPLHLYGEHNFPVPPLQLPRGTRNQSLEELYGYEAINLFVQRAMLVRPDFTLTDDNAVAITEICHSLDGLPLAIELAAARINVLPPQAMLSRMEERLSLLTRGPRDLHTRHQTLRNTIEWGYRLLSGDEQKLFRRLAVFAGGCTFEAVQVVCGTPPAQPHAGLKVKEDVLEALASLIDKSLVSQQEALHGEPRFHMLETICEYARERLQESGEGEVLQREHALYFMSLAEAVEPHLTGGNQQQWLDLLEAEHDNIRIALRWARRSEGSKEDGKLEAVGIGLRIGGAIRQFWSVKGYYSEGRGQLHGLLDRMTQLVDAGADAGASAGELRTYRAKVLKAAGSLAYGQGDHTSARALHEESLAIYRELDDKQGIAQSLTGLGNIAHADGEYGSARAYYEQSLAIHRELGDKRGIAISLGGLGVIAHSQGDHTAARSLIHEVLAIHNELGDKGRVAWSLHLLGSIAQSQGDYVYARTLGEQSLVINQELSDKQGIAWSLNNLGLVAQLQSDYATARALHERSLVLERELEARDGIATSLHNLGLVAQLEGDYPSARVLHRESLAIYKGLDDKQGIVVCLVGLGEAMVGNASNSKGAEGQMGGEPEKSVNTDSPAWEGNDPRTKWTEEEVAGKSGEQRTRKAPRERGIRLFGAVEALPGGLSDVLKEPHERQPYEQAIASAHALLREEAFERAWQEGRAMSMEQAVEYALDDSMMKTDTHP